MGEWLTLQFSVAAFAGMALARLPRLSVQPVSEAEWRIVCQMGEVG